MRMPNSREISDEQEEIYMDAPMDGVVMVAGPPGTGKTVIAFLRAQALNKRKKSATVMMYGKVLQKYTSNISDQQEDKVHTTTLLSWAAKWWREHKINTRAVVGEKIYLKCPYDSKDEAKAHGARWDRFKNKWWVNSSDYNNHINLFEQWLLENHEPPKVDDFQLDWQLMMEKLAVHIGAEKPILNFGHIIIDEAQDFPPSMFRLLRFALMKMDKSGITILADENQRMNEDHNATIEEINGALAIPEKRQYLLTENFRNTLEIAQLASHFYVGLPTGKPRIPRRKGEKPVLVTTRSIDDQVQYIVDAATNRAYGEVGVFAQSDSMRDKLYSKLQHRLRGLYRVQTYSSKEKYRDDHPVDDLIFDTKGTLTVINRQSCKGLEFDAVFIPELQTIPIDGSNLDTFKMNMYVMCSRARQALHLLYTSSTDEEPDIVTHLPDQSSGLLDKSGITTLADENQRLNEDYNARMKETSPAPAIPDDRQYSHKESFRNAFKAVQMASGFYSDPPTDKPDHPRHKGEKPVLVPTHSFDEQVQYIVDAVTNSTYDKVGVFTESDSVRDKLYDKLQHRLKGLYRVQIYSAKEKYRDDQTFDTKGTLKIINHQSCKGLEYDAVFIPELQTIPIDDSDLDTFKKDVCVMSTKVSQALYLLFTSSNGEEPEIVARLPDQLTGLLDFYDE